MHHQENKDLDNPFRETYNSSKIIKTSIERISLSRKALSIKFFSYLEFSFLSTGIGI